MQRIVFTGNIGKDLDLKYTETRKKLVDFSVAVNEKINKEETITTWLNCRAWEGRAEYLSKYVKKGDKVYFEGRIRNDKYKTKDGQEKYYTYVLIDYLEPFKNEKKEEKNDLENLEFY